MEYLQSIRSQTTAFLGTVGFGFLLGASYDLCRLVRLLTGSRRIAVWDIVFGAVSGAATFLFALTQDGGKVRVYLLAAIGVGFAVWYFFAGRPVRSVTDRMLRMLRRAVPIARRPFARVYAHLAQFPEKLRAHGKKVVKKLQKNRKSS